MTALQPMDETFHIAVSCNECYVPGALVALAGVAVNARPEMFLAFHVFTESVKAESIDFMSSTLKRLHANSEFCQHVCGEDLLAGLPYWAGSRMAAVRCHYATLMPDVDWCLYLDCDVLYLASVEEHFSYRDESVYACVVQEESARTRRSERLWIRDNCGVEIPDDRYFNSGVVLFNFKKMREDEVPERLMRFFKDHPKVPSPDQDALNATFGGKVRMIPPKFDRLQVFLNDDKMNERPVVHYVCGNPWLPKSGVVANNRFRMWHRFADKYVWMRKGESCRQCFSKKLLVLKFAFYWVLKTPIVGRLLALIMQLIGKTSSARSWQSNQVGCDLSSRVVLRTI
ncbi:MAG: hypothetical protein IKF72_09500 [Kiritimatiellae bacterium]|nr:hypothetical protein [Kiritimatiellia bacterium]